MTMSSTEADLRNRSDTDDAAEFAFALVKELGLATGDLGPADFRKIVSPLLEELNLRVGTEDRFDLEREYRSWSYDDHWSQVANVRERIKKLNGIRDDILGESGSAARRASAEKLPPDLDDEIEP